MKDKKAKDTLPYCPGAPGLIASALLLTVIQPPIGLAPLAWVALVPFIQACSPAARPKPLAAAAYLVGLGYWLGNLYWIFPVTVAGWATFCLYTALLWPILALALRYCRIKKVPLLLAVPVLFVGAERLQGLLLGGFFWRHLAHSQYANTTLIQIADIFGAAGVSFLVVMVNALLAELITAAAPGPARRGRLGLLFKAAVVCAALLATVIYGRWRVNQSDQFVEPGPMVASLQSNVPQSVKRTFQAEDEIFDDLMADSNTAANAGAELIVWPETMVQGILNPDIWAYFEPSDSNAVFDRARAFDKQLREHAKDTASLLVGAYGGRIKAHKDTTYLARYNSAFLYEPGARHSHAQYDKIHLVPFGEVVPFRRSLPALYDLLMKFTPYNYDYSLDYGSEYTIFEISTGRNARPRTYRFGVMICYEDTVPYIARTFALDAAGKKRVDWLLNISNDGWFVRFKKDKVLPTTELPQHVAVCVFRAVENRLAVLRSVNTGISCTIDTLGRIRNGFIVGNLPNKAMDRKGISGWYLDLLPIDKRVTVFSRHGQWLDLCCAVCLGAIVIVPPLAGYIRNKKHPERPSGKANGKNRRKP